jgi:hypothetical protein
MPPPRGCSGVAVAAGPMGVPPPPALPANVPSPSKAARVGASPAALDPNGSGERTWSAASAAGAPELGSVPSESAGAEPLLVATVTPGPELVPAFAAPVAVDAFAPEGEAPAEAETSIPPALVFTAVEVVLVGAAVPETEADTDGVGGSGAETVVIGVETVVVATETVAGGVETVVIGVETVVVATDTVVVATETVAGGVETVVIGVEAVVDTASEVSGADGVDSAEVTAPGASPSASPVPATATPTKAAAVDTQVSLRRSGPFVFCADFFTADSSSCSPGAIPCN